MKSNVVKKKQKHPAFMRLPKKGAKARLCERFLRSNLLLDKHEIASSRRETRDSQRHFGTFGTASFDCPRDLELNHIIFQLHVNKLFHEF